MTKDEALKLALEALEEDELDMVDDGNGNMVFRKEQAITAIKEALAESEQEPLAWISSWLIRIVMSLLSSLTIKVQCLADVLSLTKKRY